MNQIVKSLKETSAQAGTTNQWKLEELCKMAALEIEVKIKFIAELEAQRDNLVNLLKQGAELVNEYARLTAANESMQEDAVQNTYAFGQMLHANKEQAEEIRTLKTTMGLLIEVAKLVPDLDPDCMAGIVLKEAQAMISEAV